MSGGRITTHVLDTARGRPAAGIGFALTRLGDGAPVPVASGHTDPEGRAPGGPLLSGDAVRAGTYELTFAAGEYLRAAGEAQPFYADITIRFVVADPSQHYHVPLILAPYGYSTYRGS
jgi:5-hydroxyisourate hydrolase